jgi:hypothetical protein
MNKVLQPSIVIDLKKPLIRIHKSTLHILGNPEYILLLVNPNERTIAVLPSEREDSKAHHVSKYSLRNNKSFELYSTNLIRNLKILQENWENNGIYKIYGFKIQEQNIVKFNMSEAFISNLQEGSND